MKLNIVWVKDLSVELAKSFEYELQDYALVNLDGHAIEMLPVIVRLGLAKYKHGVSKGVVLMSSSVFTYKYALKCIPTKYHLMMNILPPMNSLDMIEDFEALDEYFDRLAR